MRAFKTSKKLHRLDLEIDALEGERRALEARDATQPGGGEREPLADLERRLQALRQRRHAAAVEHWTAVASDTRAKLADLKSDSLLSGWRRGIFLDVVTLFWILAGAGWFAFGLAGTAVGAVLAVIASWFIVRRREPMRLMSIRQGEDILRESEIELRRATREAATGAMAGTPQA